MQVFDKENSLSFQNITQTMKLKKCRRDGSCFYHPDKQGKYRDRESDILYCKSCAVQQASRGVAIEELRRTTAPAHFATLQQVYDKAQSQMQQYIRIYNTNFHRLMELLTDLQIRDLLTFNRKIEENHSIFEQLKQDSTQQWDRFQLEQLFASESSSAVLLKLSSMVQEIEGYRTDSALRSCNLTEKHSPKLTLKNRSQTIEPKELKMNVSNISLQEKTLDSRESGQSFSRSPNNTNSFKSKNSTFEDIKKSTYEDTPESVKFRTSEIGFKVTGNMATTMFEKIDVCESISLSNQSEAEVCGVDNRSQESGENRSSFSSLKSRYRTSIDL